MKKNSIYTMLVLGFCLWLSFKTVYAESNVLSFGVVPQQEAKKLRALWMPFVEKLATDSGLVIQMKTADDIGSFQSKMLSGQFDVTYSNPLLYIIANSSIGYTAIAKEKDKRLHGIFVVRNDSEIASLEDLKGKSLVFPEHAFAATVLTQAKLNKFNIPYKASFVYSHDAAYKFVSLGKFVAAGGVERTFKSLDPAIRSRLRILKRLDGVTPHAFSVHPRISQTAVNKLKKALNNFSQSDDGKQILENLRMNALGLAGNKDWNDVRKAMASR